MTVKTVVLATRNPGKIQEIGELLAGLPLKIITHDRFDDWPLLEETGDTFAENAALKAVTLARFSGLPALADDSGLEVDALEGRPGVRSARYAGVQGDDAANIALLLENLSQVPAGRRDARFVCVISLAHPSQGSVEIRETCEGGIAEAPRGDGGFGYDPVFLPLGMDRTMAELTLEEKNAVSHRGKALRRLREMLETGEPPWL